MANTPTLKTYVFSKRENSTKRPSDGGATLVASTPFKLKDRAMDWRSPVIQVSSNGLSALTAGGATYAVIENYEPFEANQNNGRAYYFIENITFKSNRVITYYLKLDVLATYRDVVLSLGGVVNYCSNPQWWSPLMDDTRMSPAYWAKTQGAPAADAVENTSVGRNVTADYWVRDIFNVTEGSVEDATAHPERMMVITKVQDIGATHIYMLRLDEFFRVLANFISWLLQQATEDVPSKDWKSYFITCFAYRVSMNNTPFSDGHGGQNGFTSSSTFMVCGHNCEPQTTVWACDYLMVQNNTLSEDSIPLMRGALANQNIGKWPQPWFMRRSKYQKITIVSPWDTQVVDQDKYDADYMWMYSTAIWDTNSFYIVGRQRLRYHAGTYEDDQGEISYISHGPIGLDLLDLINIQTATSARMYHASLGSAVRNFGGEEWSEKSLGVGSEVKQFDGSVNTYDVNTEIGSTADTALSTLPILGTLWSKFNWGKRYYSDHAGVTGNIRMVDGEGWAGREAIIGYGNGDRMFSLHVIYTQCFPVELDHYTEWGASTKPLFRIAAHPGSMLERYGDYCMRYGWPVFSRIDEIGSLVLDSTSRYLDYITLDGKSETYVELSTQIFPANLYSWGLVPYDIKIKILDTVSKGIWIYHGNPS